MSDAAPGNQGTLESIVHLVDVLTDPTVVVLVLVIVFRKQIGPHVANVAQQLGGLLSRMQSARVGTTRFDFTPTDLQAWARSYDPELLRQILLQLPEAPTPAGSEEDDQGETEQQTDAESVELATFLQELRQSGQEEPKT